MILDERLMKETIAEETHDINKLVRILCPRYLEDYSMAEVNYYYWPLLD